jgi:hypothetical protein
MRFTEIQNFYKNATKDQIRTLVESQNSSSVQTDLLTELIYSANHDEVWTDDLMEGVATSKPIVSVKRSQSFADSMDQKVSAGNKKLPERFEAFLQTKLNNLMQPFGKSDKPFLSAGFIRNAIPNETLLHAHLTPDISIIYSITGKDEKVIKLYGVYTHDEMGIGQPPNIRKQKQFADRLSNTAL